MEIQLIKSNERNKVMEKKLIEKKELLEYTQKELMRCKNEIKKSMDSPTVHSDLLNVINSYNSI